MSDLPPGGDQRRVPTIFAERQQQPPETNDDQESGSRGPWILVTLLVVGLIASNVFFVYQFVSGGDQRVDDAVTSAVEKKDTEIERLNGVISTRDARIAALEADTIADEQVRQLRAIGDRLRDDINQALEAKPRARLRDHDNRFADAPWQEDAARALTDKNVELQNYYDHVVNWAPTEDTSPSIPNIP